MAVYQNTNTGIKPNKVFEVTSSLAHFGVIYVITSKYFTPSCIKSSGNNLGSIICKISLASALRQIESTVVKVCLCGLPRAEYGIRHKILWRPRKQLNIESLCSQCFSFKVIN